jgi:pantetheine-phosphate adenylyltransferase
MSAPPSPPIAIYPGSFDPITLGHVNIIQRSLRLFERLVVAVAQNETKVPMFTVDERVALITESLGNDPRIDVLRFEGLLVDYARGLGARTVIRGLRAVSDFEYEFQMAHMNHKLHPELETVFMMTGQEHFYVSSRLVKEVASFGGDVSGLVPDCVLAALNAKTRGR